MRFKRGLYKLAGGGCVTFSSVNGDGDGEERRGRLQKNRWLIDRLYVHENWSVNYETGL